jgi:O-antigen ligase
VQRTLLLLLVAASYLLFAGGRTWTLAPLLVLAAAAAMVAPRRTFSFPKAGRPLDLALIALLLAIGMQLLPLPARLVEALSPHAADVRSAIHFSAFGQPAPAWATLTVNPPATLVALGTVALGVLTFWSARGMFGAGGSTRAVCRALAFLGALAAVMAVIQRAVAPSSVLFVIEPEARSANPFGAFVNRNHFGAWLLLVAAPVSGYCIARLRIHPTSRGHWRQSLGQVLSSGAVYTALAAFVQVGVLLLTVSRSAVAGLGVAALTIWGFGRSRVAIEIERTRLPAALGIAGAALLMIVLFVDTGSWAKRFEQSFGPDAGAFSRQTIWRESLPVMRDFWLTGSGAGTYADAMTRYQQTRVWVGSMYRWAFFNNAHSHYVQVASEGGLLIGLPALLVMVLTGTLGLRAVRADKGEMFWVRVGAAAGLAGLATQSIWEVALIMPANAVLAGVVGGLLLYRRDPARLDSAPPTPERLTPRPTPARAR